MTKFGSLPWMSRSHHDLASKSRPAHNFVIWSRILKLFHRNDHHIKTMCRAHQLGRYLEGQGHSMTLQQNRVRSITLLFKVGFYNFFWQTTSLCPISIRGALPGSDRLLFIPVTSILGWIVENLVSSHCGVSCLHTPSTGTSILRVMWLYGFLFMQAVFKL